MNGFYKVVSFLRERLEQNENVNTIIFARTSEMDLHKKNIYPIVHINPSSAPFNSTSVSTFSFEIGAFDQRDSSSTITLDKFEKDDIQDNLNITYSILNDLYMYIKNSNNDDLIELENITSAEPAMMTNLNTLDGWYMTITLKIPNTQICN